MGGTQPLCLHGDNLNSSVPPEILNISWMKVMRKRFSKWFGPGCCLAGLKRCDSGS